jgi:hypothetical protein
MYVFQMKQRRYELIGDEELVGNRDTEIYKCNVQLCHYIEANWPKLNNTGLFGPMPIQYSHSKHEFQYNSNINTIPIWRTNICKRMKCPFIKVTWKMG